MLRVEVTGEHEGGKGAYLRSKANKLGLVAAKNLLKCFAVVWLPASSTSNPTLSLARLSEATFQRMA